jgi:hypothetical protein
MDRQNAKDLSLTSARFDVATAFTPEPFTRFSTKPAHQAVLSAPSTSVTPPLVDESDLVTVDEDMTGDWIRPNLDEVGPYFSWTDDLGPEQLGNGHSLAPGPQNAHSPSQPKILKMVQNSDQPAVGPWRASRCA